MEALSLLWNEIFLRPMINLLVLLYVGLFHNMGLAILAFTVIIRLLILPLTLKQIRQTKAITELQPKLRELQRRYGKDRQRLSQETLRLYREAGVSPLGCLGPFVIQLPIWIGLFQALVQTLPSTPDAAVNLASKLYAGLGVVHRAVPLNNHFFGMDLSASPASAGSVALLLLPLLVGLSTWAQTKMTTPPSSDPKQQSQNTMMLWMMPVLLAFFSLQFPTGLSLYWVASNLIGIVIQGFITGWEPLMPKRAPSPAVAPQERKAQDPPAQSAKEAKSDGGSEGSLGQDGGRGHRTGPEGTGRQQRRGRDRGNKRG